MAFIEYSFKSNLEWIGLLSKILITYEVNPVQKKILGSISKIWSIPLLFCCTNLYGQCPTVSFVSTSGACINENITISNGSNADNYEWEFCAGGVSQSATGVDLGIISETSIPNAIETIYDQGTYYSFIASTNNSRIIRLDYGTDLSSTPDVVDLGNFSGAINGPIAVSIRKISTEWLVFVANQSIGLVRLNFGNDITNTNPDVYTYTGLVDFVNVTTIRDIELVLDNGEYKLLASGNNALGTIAILNLGASPATNNMPVESSFEITGAASIVGISLISDCQEWVGLAVDYAAGLKKIDFGSSINNTPSIESVSGVTKGVEVEVIAEKGGYYGLAMTDGGDQFYRINFNGSISSTPTIESFGNLGLLNRAQGFGLVENNGKVFGIAVNRTRRLIAIDFSYTCPVNTNSSTQETPVDLFYQTDGTWDIYLKGHSNHDDGVVFANQTVSVSPNTAPSISFTPSDNECLSQPNTFTPIDGGGLAYAWDFDNNGSTDSTDPAPSYNLGATGEHIIKLTVDDGTCTNNVQDTVNIFPAPVTPTFFTSGTPYCTGANIDFTNLFDETGYEDATLTYSWNYNGESSSTDRNGSHNFDTDGTKTITLTASIPGCSTPSAGTDINLIAGPSVGFSYENQCLGDDTQFTNLSTGTSITGQTWDFGDLNGSSSTSPSHEYEAAGDYNVSLTVNNVAGCSNELVIPLTIDDQPVANFNMGVGCEGQVVGFENQSTINGANIESYVWDFGGLGSSTLEDPNFTFETEGNYQVKLNVESTFGCTDEITKNLNVQLAAVTDFDIELGCLDATTQFIDQTVTEAENPINIWYWDINGNIVPNTQNPTEVFDTPGEYTATLTVTPSNLCVSSVSKDFIIHELPVADFTTDKNCDNELTSFTDASTSATTDVVAQNWQFDENGSGSSNPAVFNFEKAGNYEISLTVTDDIGCESSTQRTITINPAPIADFEVSSNIGPAPLTIDFTNQSKDASSYLWHFNDDEQTTTTEANPQFSYTELGDYAVELISSTDLGCSDTLSMPITVADPVLDLALLQISQEESEGKVNLSLSVKNNGNVTIENFDIRIDLDNNSSIFEQYSGTLLRGQTITHPLNFTFSADDNNIGYTCISLIDLQKEFQDINIVNNEACIDFEQKLIVENSYPNPASSTTNDIRLNMILPTKAPVQIFLLDAAGAVLFQEVYSDTSLGLNSFFLDINSYQQGIYFIKVIYDEIESTQRFVKI